MSTTALLGSIANTLADYRAGEIPQPTPAHVEKWVSQFAPATRDAILVETDHILKHTYVSRADVTRWLTMLASNPTVTGATPADFWSGVTVVPTPGSGKSQHAMRAELEAVVRAVHGVVLGAKAGASSRSSRTSCRSSRS